MNPLQSRSDECAVGCDRLDVSNINKLKPDTSEAVSTFSGLRHSRLCELLFQAEFSLPPLQYHKLQRLKRACDLLLEKPFDKVEMVRLEIGYDHSRFYRDFRTHFGVTPSQYRERNVSDRAYQDPAGRKSQD